MLTERQGERLRSGSTPSARTTFAGLTLPWNSGVLEGHVNRIKMLKRHMFGRAGFALNRTGVGGGSGLCRVSALAAYRSLTGSDVPACPPCLPATRNASLRRYCLVSNSVQVTADCTVRDRCSARAA